MVPPHRAHEEERPRERADGCARTARSRLRNRAPAALYVRGRVAPPRARAVPPPPPPPPPPSPRHRLPRAGSARAPPPLPPSLLLRRCRRSLGVSVWGRRVPGSTKPFPGSRPPPLAPSVPLSPAAPPRGGAAPHPPPRHAGEAALRAAARRRVPP